MRELYFNFAAAVFGSFVVLPAYADSNPIYAGTYTSNTANNAANYVVTASSVVGSGLDTLYGGAVPTRYTFNMKGAVVPYFYDANFSGSGTVNLPGLTLPVQLQGGIAAPLTGADNIVHYTLSWNSVYPSPNIFGNVAFKDVPYGSVIAGGIKLTTPLSNTAIQVTFTPNYGLSLADAAGVGGFSGFNWVQQIVVDPYPLATNNGTVLSTPYFDPPVGGYLDQPWTENEFPYYYNLPADANKEYTDKETGFHVDVETDTSITLFDRPEGPFLPGQYYEFVSNLVGICIDGITQGCTELPNNDWVKDLYTVVWTTNYTGNSGGVTTIPPSSSADFGDYTDPGYGYGGITILSTSYPLEESATVPESSTWAMMLIGFAGFGLLSCRAARKDRLPSTV